MVHPLNDMVEKYIDLRQFTYEILVATLHEEGISEQLTEALMNKMGVPDLSIPVKGRPTEIIDGLENFSELYQKTFQKINGCEDVGMYNCMLAKIKEVATVAASGMGLDEVYSNWVQGFVQIGVFGLLGDFSLAKLLPP